MTKASEEKEVRKAMIGGGRNQTLGLTKHATITSSAEAHAEHNNSILSRELSRAEVLRLSSTIGRASQREFDGLSAIYLRDLSVLCDVLTEKLKRTNAIY